MLLVVLVGLTMSAVLTRERRIGLLLLDVHVLTTQEI
jgi:hypothetical protein